MIRPALPALWLATVAVFALSACESQRPEDVTGNIIDDARIEHLLLTSGDPDEAVRYFENALAEDPGRADFRRGLAISLARARRYPEAARIYGDLIAAGQAEPGDRLEYAYISARLDRWADVETVVAALPTTLHSTRRYLVEAMAADHLRDWTAADAAYASAEKLATDPAGVLNNWGVSLMARGDPARAEKLFERALSFDSTLVNAKNNLAIARGLQGDFRLPPIPMTETEEAHILNNLGVIAMRNGQKATARSLFAAAVEAHPRYYAAAARRLESLGAGAGG